MMFAGKVRLGGVVSRTCTVNEPLALFPALSVAVQLTVVIPSANVVPAAGVQAGVIAPSTRSEAVAVNETAAPAAEVASAMMLSGSVSIGGVVSTTFTLNDAVASFPAASLAEQFTAVSPSGNVLPEAGVHSTSTSPSTSSLAVALKLAMA